jgi:hypothetical protein
VTDEPNLNALSPVQARAAIGQRGEDAQWRDAYLSGSVPHRKEMDLLLQRAAVDERIDDIVANAGAAGANVPSGASANVAGVSPADVRAAAGWLHDANLSDGAIAELLRGKPIPDDDFRKLEPEVKERMFGDRDWVARLMAGGADRASATSGLEHSQNK